MSHIRHFHLWGVALLLATCLPAPAGAAVSATQADDHYVLENDFVRLRINPAKGGVIDSYLLKAENRELIKDGGFLLGDHFWQQLWPGEFLSAKYDARITEAAADRAAVEVSCVSRGWNNSTAQAGIRVVRVMTLQADSPLLHVEVRLDNVGKVGRLAGYWSQNIIYAGGDKLEKQLFYRPSLRGVSEAAYLSTGSQHFYDDYGNDFVRDPQQGWMATLGAASHSGLVFAMRYDELMFLYNCTTNFTTEWQYNTAAIPAGKAWKTNFVVYPVSGLPRVDYASRSLVAAVEPVDEKGKVTVRLHLAAAGQPLEDLTIDAAAVSVRQADRPSASFPAQRLPRVERKPAVVTFQQAHDPFEPLALRFTVRGKLGNETFTETFETWYGAKYGFNRQVDGSPLYVLPAPERKVTFLKPDVIEKRRNETPLALFARGPFGPDYLPAPLFEKMQAGVTASYFKPAGTFPATLTEFPGSYEDLMALDVIALINVDTAALGAVGQEMLKDYVTHGGTLLYGGDLWAYGRGHLAGSPLADLLPVTLPTDNPTGTLQYLRDEPVSLCDENGKPTRPLAPNAVMCYAGNVFTLKPGARVLLACPSAPAVVSWSLGKGRVIAITGTALGNPLPGHTLFTRTPEWAEFMARLLGK